MASMSDIKRRIKSIESTQQITKAMYLVSTAKLQKAKRKVQSSRPFFEVSRQTIASIIKSSGNTAILDFDKRDVKKTCYVVITSDRGLAGGYNSNICKLVLSHIDSADTSEIVAVGKRGKDYFNRRGYSVKETISGATEEPEFSDAVKVGNIIIDMFENKEVDEVYLAYTNFKSTISQVPKLLKLFPLSKEDFEDIEIEGEREDMNYEPSVEYVLSKVIPRYINSMIFGAIVESGASEQGARMTAMDSATNNANDMISSLTLKYNRARQAAITQEISEIVGGAGAQQ